LATLLRDLSGQRFGSLVAVERVSTDRHGNTRWRCECQGCGGSAIVLRHHLLSGRTQTCGCGLAPCPSELSAAVAAGDVVVSRRRSRRQTRG
jgi:hypothetical protein